ncbi:hypothetical protein BJN34_23295 [Cupriavidus necator]|uniref:Uncharacterized protein n=1 Tax=Cupriavidus necator TaxID=106590 RepID=A0A1U9UW51_CUPNE|nr:hypothetical protein [Cupriavidus necator]AQV96789.1 hypothetical protein BJN34_23295 [Cupriavidus necator]
MNKLHPLKTLLIAGTFAAALAAGLAQAAEPQNGTRRDSAAPFAGAAWIVAGRDLTGVSASPACAPDSGAEAAPAEQAGPSAESARTLAGWDRTGPSAPPEHSSETSIA